MRYIKRLSLCFCIMAFCLLSALPLCGCIPYDPYGFMDDGTTWISEEGDISFTCISFGQALGTVIIDGVKTDFYMERGLRSTSWNLTSVNTYYAYPSDNCVMLVRQYERWIIESATSKNRFSVVVKSGTNGTKYTEDGRVITFYRDDDAPGFDLGGREWIEFGERPVDLFDTAWRETTGAGDLQIGPAPLFFGSDNTGDYLVRFDQNMYFLYPVTSATLIGTDEFEETCLGYWKKYETQPIEDTKGLECLGVLDAYFERKTLVYDENELINLKINASFDAWKNYPGRVMETSTGYTLTVGDPATMTGTMTIDGEVVNVTWVMEDYYHSDIVRVYRTADYESEDFSAEDDLLCRMKVRCTDARHTAYVATVVGDGVFSDGTSWTYRKEI